MGFGSSFRGLKREIIVIAVIFKRSRARLRGLVLPRDFLFFLLPVHFTSSFSHSLIAGYPSAGKTLRKTTTRGNLTKRGNVSREAQCPTGRAWMINRKVRAQPDETLRFNILSMSLFFLLLSCRFSGSSSRSFNRYALAAASRRNGGKRNLRGVR